MSKRYIPIPPHRLPPGYKPPLRAPEIAGATPRPLGRIRLVRRGTGPFARPSRVPVDGARLAAGYAGEAAAASSMAGVWDQMGESSRKLLSTRGNSGGLAGDDAETDPAAVPSPEEDRVTRGYRAATEFAGIAHIGSTLKGALDVLTEAPENVIQNMSAAVRGLTTYIDKHPALHPESRAILRGELNKQGTEAFYRATNLAQLETVQTAHEEAVAGYWSTLKTSGPDAANRAAEQLVVQGVFSQEQGEELKRQGSKVQRRQDREAWLQGLDADPHGTQVPDYVEGPARLAYGARKRLEELKAETRTRAQYANAIESGEYMSPQDLLEAFEEAGPALDDTARKVLHDRFVRRWAAALPPGPERDVSVKVVDHDPDHDPDGAVANRLKEQIQQLPDPDVAAVLEDRLTARANGEPSDTEDAYEDIYHRISSWSPLKDPDQSARRQLEKEAALTPRPYAGMLGALLKAQADDRPESGQHQDYNHWVLKANTDIAAAVTHAWPQSQGSPGNPGQWTKTQRQEFAHQKARSLIRFQSWLDRTPEASDEDVSKRLTQETERIERMPRPASVAAQPPGQTDQETEVSPDFGGLFRTQ